MTPDELTAAVEAGDSLAVVRLLRDAPEAGRRAMAPVARQLRARFELVRVGGSPDQDQAATLAVYGTATVSELRAARGPASWPPRRHEAEVLTGRPASVVAPLIAWQLERFWGWHVARVLVRDGTIPTPSTEWYILRLIGDRTSARETLEEDPALLEDEVWHLFEIEGSGEFCLAARDKYAAPSETWQAALLDVAASSRAHRERLLDASLDALGRDFSTFRAGWFSRFHEALEPSMDERAARAERYAGLLRSQVKPTLTMSIAALAALEAAGRLDADVVVGRLGQVLSAAASSTATSTVRLLHGVAERDPARAGAVIGDLFDALGHPSADVQGAALSAAAALAAGPDPDAAALLVTRMDGVAASRRSVAEALLARLAGGTVATTAAVARSVAPDPSGRVAPTHPSRTIEPVADVLELAELLSALLEVAEVPDDVERALDGLGRLSDTLADDRLVRPLRRRAVTVLGRRLGDRQACDLRTDIAALVLSWLDREPLLPRRLEATFPRTSGSTFGLPGPWFEAREHQDAGADRFLARRLFEVAVAAAERRSMQLLATPTHRGGWIEPSVLVERLQRLTEPPADVDLVAALLRVGPDGRERALSMAAGIHGEAGAALRHALGAHEVVGDTPAVWAAAARARLPGADDPAVIARHPQLGPNGGRVARVAFVAGAWNEVPGGLDITLDPPAPTQLDDDQPATVMLIAPFPPGYEAGGDPAMCRWAATIWPAGTETWSTIGAVAIGRNIDWWSAEWTNRIHLEALLEPWVELGEIARTLLGVALGAKDRGERGLASDVAIAALAQARLDGAALGEALRSTVPIERARPRRWAEALADVAAVSSIHAIAVIGGVGSVLPSLESARPAELVALLRLLRELVPQQPDALEPGAVETLQRLPGRGATRKVAEEILAAVAG
jgi:hypothetical protein